MGDLWTQKTEHLLILLKAIVEDKTSGHEDDKQKLKLEIITILSRRIDR